MARKTDTQKKSIETVTHKDRRTNIPTEELRGFVAELDFIVNYDIKYRLGADVEEE